MRHRTGRYETETRQLNGPDEPEQWYWNLYRHGKKVNGGVADSEEHALFLAGCNRFKDIGDWASGRRERV